MSKKCPDVCKRGGKLLAYNSCVSVSLVLLMEAFLESTQRFGFDFNYQSTSSVEKHNTVWRCERSNVLTFYLTPVTITVHCLKGAVSIFASS